MVKQKNLKHTVSQHNDLIANLAEQGEAMTYLKMSLEEYEKNGDHTAFMLALRNVADAQGGVGSLAKKVDLDRGYIYTVLSSNGNPRLTTLEPILRAMGLKLSIEVT